MIMILRTNFAHKTKKNAFEKLKGGRVCGSELL